MMGGLMRNVCYALAVCCLGNVCAGDSAGFSFSGPEVLKLDWSTRALNVSDLNNDGLNDLAVVNNDTSQIEVLYQRGAGDASVSDKKRLSRNRWEPVVEDARFEGEGITVGFPIFDLSVGDLNGDGRDDLAYTAREVPLTVRYQTEAGNWTETREFDNFEALGWTDTVKIVDLDGDQRAELVAISADALRVFRQDAHGHLGEPEVYYVTGENPYNLLFEDVNEDGRLDALYITANGKQSLALREQLPNGAFGPERRFVFERPVRSVVALPRLGAGAPSFCSVDSRSGGLEFFHLKQAQAEAAESRFTAAQPEIYPIFKKGRDAASYAWGDMDGDGQDDLLVANPAAAELVLFLKERSRFGAPQRFPSFSAISSMSSGRFFKEKQAAVVIVSVGEKTIGVSHRDQSGRVSFPKRIVIGEGAPLVCEAVDLDADGYDELAIVNETKGGMELLIARPRVRKDLDSDWVVLTRKILDGVRRKPASIRAVDIFGKGRHGLMVFVPREAPVFLAMDQAEPLEFIEVAKGSTIRESLLKDIQRSQVSVFDVNNDGTNELVVGRSGYARALRMRVDNLEMVDQFNARRGDDVVSAVVPLVERGEVSRLVFYVAGAGEFQFLERDPDGVFRYQATNDVGELALTDWAGLNVGKGQREFIFAGEDRFWLLPARGDVWTRVVEDDYETELEDVYYSHLTGADFDKDGHLDLIAVDGKNHVAEILVEDASAWSSRMFWEIFEQNMHYQGRMGGNFEPHQIVVEDLTGDGKLDFAFLIHDRILFYPQK